MRHSKDCGEYQADHGECYCASADHVCDAFNGDVISSGGVPDEGRDAARFPSPGAAPRRWLAPFLGLGPLLCASVGSAARGSGTGSRRWRAEQNQFAISGTVTTESHGP
jgi:hypothetical protein